jgi:hypothetical protein
MITQEILIQNILAHLNGVMGEHDLAHWAEDALVRLIESDDEIPNEKLIMDILMYIGAGDTPGFPLTWEVLSGFLEQLGASIKVILVSA